MSTKLVRYKDVCNAVIPMIADMMQHGDRQGVHHGGTGIMKNAEVLLKNGHDFTELSITPNGRVSSELFAYKIFFNNKYIDTIVTKDLKTVEAMLSWLNQKYDPKILDDAEKCYLKGVIRPFRNKVKFISKGYSDLDKEFIVIRCKDGDEACLPYFKAGTMYKGMERYKKYTPDELCL